MKQTVVHLVYSLGYGGLEQVIVNLINNSKSYKINNVIITLVNNHDLYSSILVETPIYSLDKNPKSDFSSHLKLFQLLKMIKPDVINTYNFGTIEYQFTAFMAGVKTKIHSDHGRGGDDSSGKSLKRNLVRKFISYFLNKYVVVSPDLFLWGKNTLHLSDKKLQLIFNGVDTNKFIPNADKNDQFTICTVGRAHPIKNQSLLINAYKNLLDHHPEYKDTQLLIVGDGPIYQELLNQVNDLNMQSNIHLLGYRSDVVSIMNKSNLFVLSSNYEAMPMTILEAMACGLPVICTDVGGAGYLLSNNEGWLVPANNVGAMENIIYDVLQNSSLLSEKSKQGRILVESEYSIDKMIKKYLALYGVYE